MSKRTKRYFFNVLPTKCKHCGCRVFRNKPYCRDCYIVLMNEKLKLKSRKITRAEFDEFEKKFSSK